MVSYPQIIEETSHESPQQYKQVGVCDEKPLIGLCHFSTYKQKNVLWRAGWIRWRFCKTAFPPLTQSWHCLLQFSPQQIWRMATEILHHHPNSKMEDYCNIYELMKHSGVKDYLMVGLHAGALDCAGRLRSADTADLTLVLVGSSRSVWNTPFTSCFMATWWMQSVSCLLLRAGGTGTRQLLRNREENSLRPTGVCWIISSGVTKSAPSPKRVRWCLHQHPLRLLVSSIQTCLMSQCHLLVKDKNNLKQK